MIYMAEWVNDVKINLNSNNSLIFYIKIFKFVNIRCFEANYKTGSRTPIIQVFSIFCHQIPPSSYLFPLPPPISLPFFRPLTLPYLSSKSTSSIPFLDLFFRFFQYFYFSLYSLSPLPFIFLSYYFPIFLIFSSVITFPSSLYFL